MEELTSLPQGPTGLEAWPDILVRITRAPVVSIAKIRGRATTQARIKKFIDMGFHKPGDVENRIGDYLEQLNR